MMARHLTSSGTDLTCSTHSGTRQCDESQKCRLTQSSYAINLLCLCVFSGIVYFPARLEMES